MRSGEIHYIYYSVIAIFLAILGVPVAVYYNMMWVMVALIAAAMALCVYAVMSCLAFERELHSSVRKMGDFMRGMLDARLDVKTRHQPFARFQYRLNNILDIVDYHLRSEHVGFDVSGENNYIAKLRATGIYHLLGKKNLPMAQPPAEKVIILPPPEPDRNKHRLQIALQQQEIEKLRLQQRVWQQQTTQATQNTRKKLQQMHRALAQAETIAQQSSQQSVTEHETVVGLQHMQNEAAECYEKIDSQLASYFRFIDAIEQASQSSHEAIIDMQQGLDSAAEIADIIYAIAGEAHLLALSASNDAVRTGGAGDAGKGAAVIADDAKGLVRHAEAAAELVNHKLSEIEASTQKVLGQIVNVQQLLNDQAPLEALSLQIQSAESLIQAFLIEQKAREDARAETEERPPYQLFLETLGLLLELCQSIQRDMQRASDKDTLPMQGKTSEMQEGGHAA